MYYQMFPREVLELQEEIQKHPALLQNLCSMTAGADMEDKLGEVAAFCGIILDGYYNEAEILALCDKLVVELKKARQEVVIEVISSLPPPKPH